MARARARLSPASRRSARLWFAADMVAHEDSFGRPWMAAVAIKRAGRTKARAYHRRDGDHRQAAHAPACPGRAGAAARGPARAPAVLPRARDAQPQVRPPDGALGLAEAALARAPADRRAVLHRPGRQ